MKGWVYVISNKAMPGLVKVGYSTKDPELRAQELNHTGTPHPYVVEYDALTEEPYQMEQRVHKSLHQKCEAKEWYRCSVEEAVAAIKEAVGQQLISETFKQVERERIEKSLRLREAEKAREKELEDRFREEERAIRQRFDAQLKDADMSLPSAYPFWAYWVIGALLLWLLFDFPKSNDDPWMPWGVCTILGLPVGLLFSSLHDWSGLGMDRRRKRSLEYDTLLKERASGLAAVRTTVVKCEFCDKAVPLSRAELLLDPSGTCCPLCEKPLNKKTADVLQTAIPKDTEDRWAVKEAPTKAGIEVPRSTDPRDYHAFRTPSETERLPDDIFGAAGKDVQQANTLPVLPGQNEPSPAKRPGALFRTLTGHSGEVNSVVVTPDGQAIVSGSRDQTIRVWQIADGTLLRTFPEAGYVLSLALTADGQTIVSGSTDIRLWRVLDGHLLKTFTAAEDVLRVAIAPDGKTVASANFDGTVKLWRFSDGELLRAIRAHTDHVGSVAFTPDGKTLLSTGWTEDTTTRAWRFSDGQLLRTLTGYVFAAFEAIPTPDGQNVVTAGDASVKIWRLSDGQLQSTFPAIGEADVGHNGGVRSIALTADGQRVVSGSDDNTIKVWRFSDGQLLGTLPVPGSGDAGHTGKVNSVTVTPAGQTIVSGSDDGTIKLWRMP